jgi:hypothetical protein
VLVRGPAEDEIAALERDIDGVRVYRKAADGARLSEGRHADSYSYELAEIIVGADDEQGMAEKYERCVAALRFEFAEDAAGTGEGGET